MKCGIWCVFIFVLLFPSLVVRGGDSIAFSRAIQRLDTRDKEAFRESVDSILETLEKTNEFRLKVLFTKQVSDITAQKDELAHIRSLCYTAMYSDTGSPVLFKKALWLAKKNESLNWMQYVEDRWVRYYLASRQYDSAMIHILKMKDMWPKDNKDAQYLNILHLLGDMYFNAGLYDRADSLYVDISRQYFLHGPMDFWRPYVVMNNLGLIQLKYKNYPGALQWFKKSLASAEESLHQAYKINLLAYTKTKIAETYFFMDSMSQAIDFFNQAEAYPDQQIYDDAKQELLLFKSRFLLRSGQAHEALETGRQLIPQTTDFEAYNYFIPDLYLHISKVFEALNRPDSSLKYLNRHIEAKETIEKEGSKARSMIIYAEKEHAATKYKLGIYQKRYIRVLLWMIGLIAVIITILAFYRSLYRSKMLLLKNLVEKSQDKPLEYATKETNGNGNKDLEKMQLLINELHQLMKTEKPYLNSGLTINQTADMLSTNRTYLSGALNDVLNKSFPVFINEYRIKEAVNLVTKGFTDNHTIEALAHQSGFASRSVFNAVFKKQTGVTPSFLIAKHKIYPK